MRIVYVNDAYQAFTLPHGMIGFSSADDLAIGTSVGYSSYVTVEHNNSALTNTFTGNCIGKQNAIVYQSIEIVYDIYADNATKLTWTQAGTQTWLGSFQDSADSSLKFVYDGGGKLTLNSIHTNMQNSASGLVAQSGTLELAGTRTVHAIGSAAGNGPARYASDIDWHYAGTTANVEVKNGGTFELGSHARLTGDISIASGGTFVMHGACSTRWNTSKAARYWRTPTASAPSTA